MMSVIYLFCFVFKDALSNVILKYIQIVRYV